MTLEKDRMIALSKNRYRAAHPTNVVVFNAQVCCRKGGRIWYGDLDVTVDGDALKEMAARQGEELYVFRERDNTDDPDWKAAVACVSADTVTIRAE